MACPLRIAFEQAVSRATDSRSTHWALVGRAVHRAIELCLADDAPGLGVAWAQACDELATTEAADPREAPNARRAYLRLERRLPELMAFIDEREPAERLREKRLTSPDGTVIGQLDLVLLGDRPAIIDHKTGVVVADGMPHAEYVRQLSLYAWLVETALGVDVSDAALFSLRDGVVAIDVSRKVREPVVVAALAARDVYNARVPDSQPGTPSESTCGWCPFVGQCDAAWEALAQGEVETFGWGDAIRGVVPEAITLAASGAAAVPVEVDIGTVAGDGMLIDVPSTRVAGCSAGDTIAAWGLLRRSESPLTLAWRDSVSSVQIG